ncbi:MAG: hypothetical protein ACRYG8_38535 [Janthinobacterium lividum]
MFYRWLPWVAEYHHDGLTVNADQTIAARSKAVFETRFTFTGALVFVFFSVGSNLRQFITLKQDIAAIIVI